MGCHMQAAGGGVPGEGGDGEERSRSHSPPQAEIGAFERFPEEMRHRSLPVISFSSDVREMRIWVEGSVDKGEVRCSGKHPDWTIREPIAMSPAYLGFSIEPGEPRYLHYQGVGVVFARPSGGMFMQPSIDTIMACNGLERLFAKQQQPFQRVVDVGSGSGFIGKFAAVHATGLVEEPMEVTLVDIDPAAIKYNQSSGFNAPSQSSGGRPIHWTHHSGDAIELLEQDNGFDLLVSNPPYIPTTNEVVGGKSFNSARAGRSSFWEGIGLVEFLIEHFASVRNCPPGAHMVLVVSSLTLKAPAVLEALHGLADRGVSCACLAEREVAWKAWYAGPQSRGHLLAKGTEIRQRHNVRGQDIRLFVGATPPGQSRLQIVNDGRAHHLSYHWHVVYVLDFWHNAQK